MHDLEPKPSHTKHDTPGPRGWYSRGYLPHFDGRDTTQMLTFRLADSLPAHVLESWERELGSAAPLATDVHVRKRIEAYIDAGHGDCLLRDPRVARIVEHALLHFGGERYTVSAWVVMPNHVHALLTPLADHELARIAHSWKSFTAQKANKMLGRSGPFWQREYFDRYIRDERHYYEAIHYIEHNPVAAGLCRQPEDWPFGSARLRPQNSMPARMPAVQSTYNDSRRTEEEPG